MDQRYVYKKVSLSEMKNAYYSSFMHIYSFLWDFIEFLQPKGHATDSVASTEEESCSLYLKEMGKL